MKKQFSPELEIAIRISKAAYAALEYQRQYDKWSSFGTNSQRAQRAESKLDAAMRELEAADEALAVLMRESNTSNQCTSICVDNYCPVHGIVPTRENK